MNVRVGFLMYPVSNVAQSLAFYRDVVGFRPDGMNEPWWAEFDVGGFTFGIGDVPDNGIPGTAQSMVLEVPDIAGFLKRVREKGAKAAEPVVTPYGCTIAKFEDPDGNTIWLHELPASGPD